MLFLAEPAGKPFPLPLDQYGKSDHLGIARLWHDDNREIIRVEARTAKAKPNAGTKSDVKF